MKTNVNMSRKMGNFEIIQRSKELIVKNLNAWRVEYNNMVNLTGCNGYSILMYNEMSFKEYIDNRVFLKYPYIYVSDHNILTRYSKELKGYNFFPNVEHADNESAYIKCRHNSIINVVIDISPIIKDESNNINSIKKEFTQNTYLMMDGNGFTKIGKSFNPIARESTLQSENPTIELIAYTNKDVESILHSKYDHYRKRGEWFNLSKKQIETIIKNYSFIKN